MRCLGVVLATTIACLSSVAAVEFASGPDSTIVPAGGTARLTCAVDLRSVRDALTVYWYKARDGSGYYITGGSEVYARNAGAERYSLETSSVEGKYSYTLKITAVEAVDSGQYQCMGVDARGSTTSPRGTLSVVQAATSDPLACSYYPEAPTLGQTVTFSCTAPRGISPEMLSWWMAGTVRIQPSAHPANARGISFVKTLVASDNFAEFTCLVGASFDGAADPMNCSVTPLAVPIRAEVTPRTALALVGGSATLTCRGTAIPAVTKYRWIYGTGSSNVKISTSRGRFTVVNDETASTLTIGAISRQDNDSTVRCVVMNEITKTIGAATVQVTTHDATTRATTSLISSSTLAVQTTRRPAKTTDPSQARELTGPSKPRETTEPSKPTPPTSPTGKALGSSKQPISTSDNGDAINIAGCSKDCGERISSQQEPDSGEGSSNTALTAALSILAVCALATGVIVYIAYAKRGRTSGRVTKRKNKNKPLQRLRSLRLSVGNSPSELVNPDSVRLKTIEVIVNAPPPEWQHRVKDVETEEQEAQEPDLPLQHVTEALYAKPDKTRKRRHRGDDAHPPATAPSDVPGQRRSAEGDRCVPDDVSEASTWDMSSVDSGCEEETPDETPEATGAYAELDLTTEGQRDKECLPRTDTLEYENTVVTKTSLPRN